MALCQSIAAELEKMEEEDTRDVYQNQNNDWLKHMALIGGYKDPPGIKVRPMQGIDAIDYLVRWAASVMALLLASIGMRASLLP
jgi:hypothetical protein